ncbi:MAG: hypothetical protein F4X56_01140 [Gammaproteobacteria bacterium]|nr:hypothetical protein [Gammaproteobacteria bacterium]
MTHGDSIKVLPNRDILTFVLAEIGGMEKAVHLEKIADRAFELSPGAFRWSLDEFSNRIDKDKVRASLTNLEKPANGRLARAVGLTKAGLAKKTDLWELTPEGVNWIILNKSRIESALRGPRVELKTSLAHSLFKRVTSNALYKRFLKDNTISDSLFEFTDLLECSPDAKDYVIQRRFENMKKQLSLLDDPMLDVFIQECGRVHSDLLKQIEDEK